MNPSTFDDWVGQSELVAHRLIGFCLALVAFALLRTRSENLPIQLSDGESSASKRSNYGLTLTALPLFLLLLLFVRWGATEQLFVLISVAALRRVPSLDTKLNREKFRVSQWLIVSSAALACASSRTWSYPMLATALFWSSMQSERVSAFKRTLFIVCSAIAFFTFLFLTRSSFESMVSHFTQRWIYLNEPRYLSAGWLGPALLWNCVAGLVALSALQPFIHHLLTRKFSGPDFFVSTFTLFSALNVAMVQKNPQAVDVALLILIFFGHARQKITADETNSKVIHTLLKLLRGLVASCYALGLTALLIALVLLVSPATRMVPPLEAIVRGSNLVASEHPWLTALTCALALFTLFEAFVFAQRKNATNSPAESRIFVASLAATLFFATELRAFFLWDQFRTTLLSVAAHHQLLFLPKLEPLILLYPQTHQNRRMVTLFEGEIVLRNQPRSKLLIPSDVSEVCQAARWNIEVTHGIFSVCNAGDGTILHLLPLN